MTGPDDRVQAERPLSPEDDPRAGLAEERTHLAWRRSGLALLACGALVVKGLPGAVPAGRPGVGLAILALGFITWAIGIGAARARHRALESGRPAADPATLRAVAYGTAAVAVAALCITLFTSP